MHTAIRASLLLAILALLMPPPVGAQIYKVIDEDGNVTFTDQAPPGGGKPMDLPGLSIIEMDVRPLPDPRPDAAAGDQPMEPTRRELRRLYNDFRITRPAQEETFWGTGNTVVVSWASTEPIRPEMAVRLSIDGKPQGAVQQTMVSLTLDRGEHTVQAELLDPTGRPIATSDAVRFFVKQWSENF